VKWHGWSTKVREHLHLQHLKIENNIGMSNHISRCVLVKVRNDVISHIYQVAFGNF
jgi:hypothetical protein